MPHHLIDVLEPEEDFHVALFQQLAEQAMDEIYSRGKIPIIVGGTGFYKFLPRQILQERWKVWFFQLRSVQSAQSAVFDFPFHIFANLTFFVETETDFKFREELEHFAALHGADALHQRLCDIDPAAAAQIHKNNIKRTIRALEYYHQTGKKISEHNQEQKYFQQVPLIPDDSQSP